MKREYLLPESDRILILVDRPAGAEPKTEALDHLATIAAKYGERPASWLRLSDPGAPRVRWSRATAAPREAQPAREAEDSLRMFEEVPACDEPLPGDTTIVFVRYAGAWGRNYGVTRHVAADRSCGVREFPVIYLAQSRIAQDRPPVVTQTFLELRALTHEYAHVLGLGSNPSHGRWGRTVPYFCGAHCVNHECAVATPTAGALLHGKMADYCAACQRDIAQAREHWLHGTTFPESARLPQPDAGAAVAKLRPYNFRAGGEAERLIGFGKSALPPLMERIAELSGGSVQSPREQAALLALRIVRSEDGKRGASPADGGAPREAALGLADHLLRWWTLESVRFLDGDDWRAPAPFPEAR